MKEIDVIDVPKQDEVKMVMRQWVEYYNNPNRDKTLNVISLEVSNTRYDNNVPVHGNAYFGVGKMFLSI